MRNIWDENNDIRVGGQCIYAQYIYIYTHTHICIYMCVCDTLMKITEASCGFLSDSILVRQKIGYQRRRRR